MATLVQYYDRRASEYERVYRRPDPARQAEQDALAAALREALRGRRVLEIACGTGFWTRVAAQVASHVLAIDASPRMLAAASQKGLPGSVVELRQADAYELANLSSFDAALAAFWLSHVPTARLGGFLEGLHQALEPGSVVFMADNVYLPGVGGELLSEPGSPDTFKLRTLSDGSEHKVLKNYYDAARLPRLFAPRAADLRVHVGACFWWITYVIA